LAEAQSLLDSGRAFQAHEVLEGTWKAAPSGERDLWRGLAQFAVGITHAQRGNTVGAASLLRRAADRISPWRADPPYRIDVDGLISWALSTADRIEAGDRPPASPPRLTLSTLDSSDSPRVE
jgi:predicted metal-dependent hydrolase